MSTTLNEVLIHEKTFFIKNSLKIESWSLMEDLYFTVQKWRMLTKISGWPDYAEQGQKGLCKSINMLLREAK